jgi:hypothetical protein
MELCIVLAKSAESTGKINSCKIWFVYLMRRHRVRGVDKDGKIILKLFFDKF